MLRLGTKTETRSRRVNERPGALRFNGCRHRVFQDYDGKLLVSALTDKEIDGWDLRQKITDLFYEDMVPSPKVVESILEACRRVNDYALTIRSAQLLAGPRNAKLPTAVAHKVLMLPFEEQRRNCTGHAAEHLTEESVGRLEQKFINYFSDKEIDGWDLRQKITDLFYEDMVPSPKVVESILEACRRVNDYALTIRFLEALHAKTGQDEAIFEWLMAQVKPTMDKLGISTLKQLGYDKPELWMEDNDDL
ncbi:unnamed protein product [Notodromas monacha]|uniref:Cytochrome c oxidase subunit 5A, mitochondrial n=1 Tax=Notodromas monacha TaxID=399045 RepID=A0A7R9GG72_9CRUS|nr:unnamed protein product [Notodromas monacha]CAG0919661.1 unnamed protein product [Notodromas monacha]